MKLFVAHMSSSGRSIAKIKDDFHNAFRYYMFMLKDSKTRGLPDRVDYIFKMRGFWYVNVAVQVRCFVNYCQMKVNRYFQSFFGKRGSGN